MPPTATTAADVVADKEIIIAVLGSAGTLAGIVLVFVGFTIAALDGFPPGTADSVLLRYRVRIVLGAVAVAIGLLCVLGAVLWLLGAHGLYAPTLAAFFVEVAATVAVASLIVWGAVRGD
jgi:hypothetical protein